MAVETREIKTTWRNPQKRHVWSMPPDSKRPGDRTVDMLVLCQGIRQEEPYGCLIYDQMEWFLPFSNIRELIFQIDAVGRKMRGSRTDSFRERPYVSGRSQQDTGNREQILVSGRRIEGSLDEEIARQKPRGFFHITLAGMEHGSLQGSIRGKGTGGRLVCFRSALELMYLLSSVSPP